MIMTGNQKKKRTQVDIDAEACAFLRASDEAKNNVSWDTLKDESSLADLPNADAAMGLKNRLNGEYLTWLRGCTESGRRRSRKGTDALDIVILAIYLQGNRDGEAFGQKKHKDDHASASSKPKVEYDNVFTWLDTRFQYTTKGKLLSKETNKTVSVAAAIEQCCPYFEIDERTAQRYLNKWKNRDKPASAEQIGTLSTPPGGELPSSVSMPSLLEHPEVLSRLASRFDATYLNWLRADASKKDTDALDFVVKAIYAQGSLDGGLAGKEAAEDAHKKISQRRKSFQLPSGKWLSTTYINDAKEVSHLRTLKAHCSECSKHIHVGLLRHRELNTLWRDVCVERELRIRFWFDAPTAQAHLEFWRGGCVDLVFFRRCVHEWLSSHYEWVAEGVLTCTTKKQKTPVHKVVELLGKQFNFDDRSARNYLAEWRNFEGPLNIFSERESPKSVDDIPAMSPPNRVGLGKNGEQVLSRNSRKT